METELEHTLTSFYKVGMIRYLREHPEDFEEAIQLAVSDKQPYSWRAAWLLWSCMDKNDERVKAHVGTIMDVIPSLKDGHQRELMKILYNMDLDEAYEGRLFSLCMDLWEQIHKTPSVRGNAFILIYRMAQKYPELMNEIELLTQEQYMESLSPGIRHSLLKIMKKR
jgi:hypothetical protein